MNTEPLALYSPETSEITTEDDRHVPVPRELTNSLEHLSCESRLDCLSLWARRMGFIGSETSIAQVVYE